MKIVLKSNDDINIRIPLPSGLFLNRFAVGFAQKYLKKYCINVSKKQTIAFIKELNRYRRKHPEWQLVEIQSADGYFVTIKF